MDEFAAELNDDVLRIHRPKMNEEMNTREVERTRRIYEEFEEKYEKEMRKGLVDGARLRKAQYDALKLRDEAFRVYNVCKQKLNQQKRSKEIGEVVELKLTTVTSEMYSQWIQEVKVLTHLLTYSPTLSLTYSPTHLLTHSPRTRIWPSCC